MALMTSSLIGVFSPRSGHHRIKQHTKAVPAITLLNILPPTQLPKPLSDHSLNPLWGATRPIRVDPAATNKSHLEVMPIMVVRQRVGPNVITASTKQRASVQSQP